MASLNLPTILITIFSLALSTATATATAAEDTLSYTHRGSLASSSFYDVLQSNGLPIGLFPKGISNFSLDPSSGQFELHLLYPAPCDAQFETHMRFECNITGSLTFGKIANLSGVAAQELFLWLPVKGIQVDIPSSGLIYFDVGVVYKQFSLSFFETPKDCDSVKGDVGEDETVVSVDDRDRGKGVESHPGNYLRERPTEDEKRAEA